MTHATPNIESREILGEIFLGAPDESFGEIVGALDEPLDEIFLGAPDESLGEIVGAPNETHGFFFLHSMNCSFNSSTGSFGLESITLI
jgi:hypothetical protein